MCSTYIPFLSGYNLWRNQSVLCLTLDMFLQVHSSVIHVGFSVLVLNLFACETRS